MIASIIIGLFVGIIAKFLMPGRDPGGFIITIVLGIFGAMLAHWIGVQMGYYLPDEPAGFLASVGGAMLILLAYRLLFKSKS